MRVNFLFTSVFVSILLVALMTPTVAMANQSPFALERYTLDELHVLHLSKRDSHPFAYVLDPEGYVYHVETGEYLGRHSGRVTRIDICGLWIVEFLQNENQDWRENRVILEAPEFDKMHSCQLKADAWRRKNK